MKKSIAFTLLSLIAFANSGWVFSLMLRHIHDGQYGLAGVGFTGVALSVYGAVRFATTK